MSSIRNSVVGGFIGTVLAILILLAVDGLLEKRSQYLKQSEISYRELPFAKEHCDKYGKGAHAKDPTNNVEMILICPDEVSKL